MTTSSFSGIKVISEKTLSKLLRRLEELRKTGWQLKGGLTKDQNGYSQIIAKGTLRHEIRQQLVGHN